MKYARLIAGVIGGYAVLAALVIVGSMAASGILAGDGGQVTTSYLVANLVLSFAAAVAGGFACAWIAGPLRLAAVGVLAVIVLALGLLMEGGGGQPGWYPVLIPLLGVLGVGIGGWLRHEPVGNPAIL